MCKWNRGNGMGDVLSSETRTLLVLLASRCKFKDVKGDGIADYHRGLRWLFDHRISCGQSREQLERPANHGVFGKALVWAAVKNDIVDSRGQAKVDRTTRVYKRTCPPNPKNKVFKEMVERLCRISKEALGKDLAQAFSNDREIGRLSIHLRSCPSST